MTSPIQIPTLRPTDVVREPGLDQPQNQMSQLAQLLMLKGHLALETEKFQAEEAERKDKKARLAQAGQTLSQLFANPNVGTPEGLSAAIGQGVGPLTAAGAGPEATRLLGELPGLQHEARLSASRQAFADLTNAFMAGPIRDAVHQTIYLGHVGAQAPEMMETANKLLSPLQRDIKVIGTRKEGVIAVDLSDPQDIRTKVLLEPTATDPAALVSKSAAATMALQRVANIAHLLGTDTPGGTPNLDVMREPTRAAGAQNIGKSGPLTAVMGALGALGIGPGDPTALAQQLRSAPHQQYNTEMAGFIHNYITFLGGSPRSNILYEKMLASFNPGAGASDDALRNAWHDMQEIIPIMQAARLGKKIDMTKLPFYGEVRLLEDAGGAGLEGSTPTPTAAPTAAAPITAQQLLNSTVR